MNQDEHQRERMRAWITFRISQFNGYGLSAHDADERLAEFDKRFPAPAAVEVANVYDSSDGRVPVIDATELASLRTKARLWDAVASGKVRLMAAFGNGWRADFINDGIAFTKYGDTPEEAVQAAIDAGALK